MSEHSKPTQNQRILEYMRDFGSITQIDALKDLGVMRLASKISDLRKQGFSIISKREPVKNRYGETCHIKRYSIEESNLCVCCGKEIPEGRQVCPNCEGGNYETV